LFFHVEPFRQRWQYRKPYMTSSPSAGSRGQALHALTSLRFFAAAMIVIHHTHHYFGYGVALAANIALDRGVSFFFVLSGFILFYAHQAMENGGNAPRFIVSRLARIWPPHLAMALFVFIALPYPHGYPNSMPGLATYALNLLLLHSWVPAPNFTFSLNGPSWSLATELFFYVSFPFLILNWRRTRWMKLAACAALGLLAVALASALHAPVRPWGENGLYAQGFVYFLPPARIVEFCIGMLSASIWLKHRDLAVRLGSAWTVVEFAVCATTVLALMYVGRLPGLLGLKHEMLSLWLAQLGCAPAFALLIPVLAYGNGLVSKLLSARPLVLLGEISFALYLVHSPIAQILFAWPGFTNFGTLAEQLVLYWVVSIAAAWCLWTLVEKRGRELLLSQYDAWRQGKVPLSSSADNSGA
jgi:peptidoglycan/LPS O-acetylase OafA/YrhL